MQELPVQTKPPCFLVEGLTYESDRGTSFVEWESPDPKDFADIPEFSIRSHVTVWGRPGIILFPIVKPYISVESVSVDCGSMQLSGTVNRQRFRAHPPADWRKNCYEITLPN